MSNNIFATVNTQDKREKGTLNPRQTRYGLLPIWSIATTSRAFSVWELPANQVFPFRPFVGEIGQDTNGHELYRVERLPDDQIKDMYVMSPYFVELTSLSKLDDEDKVLRVAEILANDKECSKYPHELKTSCVSCWIDYLRNEVRDNIKAAFKEEPDCQRAANRTVDELLPALENALGEARRQLDKAIREIDDPKVGKDTFFETDYLNVYHTHSNRPTYRTSTASSDIGTQIAEAIKSVAGTATPSPAMDPDIISSLAAQVKELKEKLDAAEAKAAPVVEEKPKAKAKDSE